LRAAGLCQAQTLYHYSGFYAANSAARRNKNQDRALHVHSQSWVFTALSANLTQAHRQKQNTINFILHFLMK
jgi:hypothetical protein